MRAPLVTRSLNAALALAPAWAPRFVYRHPTLHRLARRVAAALFPDDSWRWVTVQRGDLRGMRLRLQPRTHKFFISGAAEPEVQQALRTLLRPGDVLWDVGAHVGVIALHGSRLVGDRGRVVAFEPDPDNAARLKANLEANGVQNVDLIAAAVGRRVGSALFEQGGDSSTGHVGSAGIRVPLTTLDAARLEYPAPDLIKIDVERSELEAIRGARTLLERRRPSLVIELHGEHDRAVAEELRRLDYTVYRLSEVHVLVQPEAGAR